MGIGRSVAVAVLLLAARMAAGAGFLEGAPVERRIALSGVDTIDIDAAHFTVEVLGAPDQDTVTVVSRMSTRFRGFHGGHIVVERNDGTASLAVRYDGRPLSQAAVTWGPRLLLQVPERTALAVTTTVGDVRIHDVAASNVTITTTAGDLYLSDVTATVAISVRAGFIVLERVHGPKRISAASGSIEVVRFTRADLHRHRRRAAPAPHRRRHQRRHRHGPHADRSQRHARRPHPDDAKWSGEPLVRVRRDAQGNWRLAHNLKRPSVATPVPC